MTRDNFPIEIDDSFGVLSPLLFLGGSDLGSGIDDPEVDGRDTVDLLDLEDSLYRKYARGVRFMLLEHCRGNEALADDLLQSTFLTVIEKLRAGDIKNPDAIQSFIYSVASNKATMHYRTEQRRGEVVDADIADRVETADLGPFQTLSIVQKLAAVAQCIGELESERDRKLLRLYYCDGVSKEKICRDKDIESVQFNKIIHRAKNRLIQIARARSG